MKLERFDASVDCTFCLTRAHLLPTESCVSTDELIDCTGYYSANVVSLSFGALAINDVVAAVVTVGFCEVELDFFESASTS